MYKRVKKLLKLGIKGVKKAKVGFRDLHSASRVSKSVRVEAEFV